MADIKSFPNNQSTYVGAEWVMRWLHGRTSGVFAAAGNAAVSAVQGAMQVAVSDGLGWIANAEANGVVWWNDTYKTTGVPLTLDVPIADGALDRIDRVIVEWETTNYVALPQIKVLVGTPAATPSAPALTNNNVLRQISLARLSIPAGTVAMTASMITDERMDDTVCGLVTESLTIDTSMVQAQMQELLETIEEELREINDGSGVVISVNGHSGVVNITAESLGALTSVNGKLGPNATLTPDDVGAMSAWELLWTNASPTSNFAAQTVSIDTQNYDFYMILCDPTPGYSEPISFIFPKGKGAFMSYVSGYSRAPNSRDAQWNASGISFLDAYSNGGANNGVCIPTAIYGIKGAQ